MTFRGEQTQRTHDNGSGSKGGRNFHPGEQFTEWYNGSTVVGFKRCEEVAVDCIATSVICFLVSRVEALRNVSTEISPKFDFADPLQVVAGLKAFEVSFDETESGKWDTLIGSLATVRTRIHHKTDRCQTPHSSSLSLLTA